MAALLACLCLLPDMAAHAQSPPRKVVVNGRVADESGDPVAGATIVERGTSNGVATLSEGEFSIAVLPGAVLDVSCLGYIDQSIGTGTRTEFEIVLQEDVKAIAEVIVTALGLERNYADLTYSADKIRGSQLTAVKDPNLILSLSGKSAGVQVNKNSSGAGASAKVSIRGVRSVASDNQPLYVVDGMPILNSTPEQAYSAIGGVADAGNRDGGDGISNLNAEDIESVSILKGAPAAALYGSQAANGVILITTKKGNARKQQPVTFTSNLTLQSPLQPACVPEPLRGERRGGKLGRPCADEDLRQCGRFFPDGDHGDECGLGFLRVGTGAELFFLCQYGRAGNHGFEPPDAP